MRRRSLTNQGVPPDENPTDTLEAEDSDDDLLDEDVFGDYADFEQDEDEDRAVPEYFEDDEDFDDEDSDDEDFDDEPRGGRRARLMKWAAALGVLILLTGGAYFGATELLGFGYEDYEGVGSSDVVVQVEEGDVTSAIAAELVKQDVVASSTAFVEASADDERVLAIQPGYYHMKKKMSGEKAVSRLVKESSRVGHFEVVPGTQLTDVIQPDDSVTPGILTLLSKASCAKLNGDSTCVSVQKLSDTADKADLKELGVPGWAAGPAGGAPRGRTLEGLIAPGLYDVKPGWNAKQLLTEVLTTSTARREAAGMPSSAGSTPFSPYQILTIASIIEREAVHSDFTKVASVIHNRMEISMALQMDSTVNYLLKRPELSTDDASRAKEGPYNTYKTTGLPPTPIAAPSTKAIEAALDPADTEYVYFVKCEKNGLSCFAKTIEKHNANVEKARKTGAF